MPITRRGLLAGAALLATPSLPRAQSGWPDRSIRLIVPFGAGGAVDTLSRTVANAFPPLANGQSLVVENRGGAGGTIAGAAAAQARPDGATLMMADLGANAIAQELTRNLSYDPTTAFTPICHLVNLPIVLLVRPELGVNSAAEFFVLAKSRREPLPYAHPGIGHASHLGQEMMLRMAGVPMTPIPYRSGAEVMRSMLAGETESSFPTVSTALPFIREGKVKAIAVGSTAEVSLLPGVKPLAETLPGFEATVWHGVVGPAGLPAEIVTAANRIFNAVMQQQAVREAVARNQAAEVVGGTPDQFAAFIKAETARWTPLIRDLGIRAE